MLFLVIDMVKLEFVQPDIAVGQMKMLQQTFANYDGLREQGKLKFAYAFADAPGGMMVLDVARTRSSSTSCSCCPRCRLWSARCAR